MRRQYLISYDIGDDKRRRKVFEFLLGQGDHAQFSVFFAEFTGRELAEARSRLRGLIHHGEDQILILDLGPGPLALEKSLEVLGKGFAGNPRVLVV